jgi:26S proteasome regulatory subunit N1
LLEEQLNSADNFSKVGSVIGLGLAYAGSAREDLLDVLTPLVIDPNLTMEMSSFAALSIGLIFVGRCHEDAANSILQTLMERPETQLNMTVARYFAVGLALLFLGQQESCDAVLEATKTITHPIGRYAAVCIESSAYVGTGNVLKVQKMLHHCLEKPEEKDSAFQSVAVIGIALIATSEDIGNDMALRMINHLLQYGNQTIKRALPIALGLLNLSNPRVNIMDLLTKLSHDTDAETSQRAIFALGLIGAGTNNSRYRHRIWTEAANTV